MKMCGMKFPWMGLLSLLAFLLVAGCFSSSLSSPPYDSQKAKETLFHALDAWKKNEVKELAKTKPPVRFEDVDFRDGFRLVDYRLEDEQHSPRPFEDIRVKLSLVDRCGRPIEKTVVYQVSLEPGLAVLRND